MSVNLLPTKFLDMCKSSVSNNEKLENDFKLLMALLTSEDAIGDKVINGVFKALVSKLANT